MVPKILGTGMGFFKIKKVIQRDDLTLLPFKNIYYSGVFLYLQVFFIIHKLIPYGTF